MCFVIKNNNSHDVNIEILFPKNANVKRTTTTMFKMFQIMFALK